MKMNRFEQEYVNLWLKESGIKLPTKHFGVWTGAYVQWLQAELLNTREELENLKFQLEKINEDSKTK